MLEADKKAKGSNGFMKLFGGGANLDEAADLYVTAANKYKAAKNFLMAAKAFEAAGNTHEQRGQDGKHEAASQYITASQMYRKAETPDNPKSVSLLTRAIELFVDLGRFQIAARHEKELAETYEQNAQIKEAITAYEQAGEWFESEDSKSNATSCKLKVAHFAAQIEEYEKAYKLFEQIGAAGVDNSLTRWSVKEYFFKAVLCYLANKDPVGANSALARFLSMDATFEATREAQFVRNLCTAVDQNDLEAFTNHVVEYDSFKKLDNWTTTILLRIKRSLSEEPSLA